MEISEIREADSVFAGTGSGTGSASSKAGITPYDAAMYGYDDARIETVRDQKLWMKDPKVRTC